MAGEINRVRLLIGDPAGLSQVFGDDDIQDVLDTREVETGVYDLYAASADLLEAWAAKVKLEFDFSADGQSFRRSQKADGLLSLAAQYRRKQQPARAVQTRSDTGA